MKGLRWCKICKYFWNAILLKSMGVKNVSVCRKCGWIGEKAEIKGSDTNYYYVRNARTKKLIKKFKW